MATSPRRWSPSTLPWWVAGLLGVALALLGAVLMLRPLASLSTLVLLVGVGLIGTGVATAAAPDSDSARWSRPVGVLWAVAGVAVLVWPDLSTRALAVVVGLAMVVDGIAEVVGAVRATAEGRAVAALGGLASVVLGVLALAWPDVTLLVVAVVFGFRLVHVGLRLGWSAFRRRPGGPELAPSTGAVGARHPGWRLARSVGALVVALALAALSAQLHGEASPLDDFYDTPDEVPSEPGVLLRSEPFDRAIPEGARAWRILYTTTTFEDRPMVASGIVVVPDAPSSEPRPVIAWAHGTTGVARHCAPSVLPDPWSAGAFFSLDRVVDEGWALVAPDYLGLGADGEHPYLVGEPTGRSVLDAVRAAHQLEESDLADATVVWGHSQGGGAALWTGGLAPTYAPDVQVVGVAALAPASDLPGLIDAASAMTGGSIFAAYAVQGYAAAYDDIAVADHVRPVARTTFRETTRRCLDGSALASVLSSVTVGMDMFSGDLTSGPLFDRLAENVPTRRIEAPLLVAQGEADGLILPRAQARYVAARCAAGQAVDHRTYAGLGHVALVEADSPLIAELLEWTRERFDGEPVQDTC